MEQLACTSCLRLITLILSAHILIWLASSSSSISEVKSSDVNKYIVDEWYCVPDASKNETIVLDNFIAIYELRVVFKRKHTFESDLA